MNGMKFDFTYGDHQVSIIEMGVDTLTGVCHTCGVTVAEVTQAEQPKYRLAYRAVDKALQQHSIRPLDTPTPA